MPVFLCLGSQSLMKKCIGAFSDYLVCSAVNLMWHSSLKLTSLNKVPSPFLIPVLTNLCKKDLYTYFLHTPVLVT